jgi:hypothetical protein
VNTTNPYAPPKGEVRDIADYGLLSIVPLQCLHDKIADTIVVKA